MRAVRGGAHPKTAQKGGTASAPGLALLDRLDGALAAEDLADGALLLLEGQALDDNNLLGGRARET